MKENAATLSRAKVSLENTRQPCKGAMRDHDFLSRLKDLLLVAFVVPPGDTLADVIYKLFRNRCWAAICAKKIVQSRRPAYDRPPGGVDIKAAKYIGRK